MRKIAVIAGVLGCFIAAIGTVMFIERTSKVSKEDAYEKIEEVKEVQEEVDWRAVKERQKVRKKLGDLTIQAGEGEQGSKQEKEERRLLENKPGIDWSDGEITATELEGLYNISSRLLQKEDHVFMEVRSPNVQELKKCKEEVFYYVDNAEIVLNAKIVKYNLVTKSKKETVERIRLKYIKDEVVLAK